jgi:hypothetical protein
VPYVGTSASLWLGDAHFRPLDFLAAAMEAKGNIANHKIAEAFAELDDDSSGYITKVSCRRYRLLTRSVDLILANTFPYSRKT